MEYYTHVKLKNEYHAGNKATDDVADICKSMGMKEIAFPKMIATKNRIMIKLWVVFASAWIWIRFLLKVNSGDVLLYQHPMYGARVSNFFIPIIQKKGCKCVAIIHDLESLRHGVKGEYSVSSRTAYISDACLLKHFNAVICHNQSMHRYLVGQGFDDNKIIDLMLFDYLTDCTYNPDRTPSLSVAIAGNLAKGKSSYIYDLIQNCPETINIHLYGVGYDDSLNYPNVIYEGSFPPDELCSVIKASYGIVWDGPTAKSCTGNTGEYLKYNNPHKLSLYLASGIPVIVWSESAVAEFVTNNNVGIAVDSLYDIHNRLLEITRTDYLEMINNINKVSLREKNGCYFKEAYIKSIEIINK